MTIHTAFFETEETADLYCKKSNSPTYTYWYDWWGPGIYVAESEGDGNCTLYTKEVYLSHLNRQIQSLQEEVLEVTSLTEDKVKANRLVKPFPSCQSGGMR